ncbi:rCG28295, partial [Rattus norvegicus]
MTGVMAPVTCGTGPRSPGSMLCTSSVTMKTSGTHLSSPTFSQPHQ